MLKKSVLVGFCVALLTPALSVLAGMDPALMVYWPLDEQSGNIAKDIVERATTAPYPPVRPGWPEKLKPARPCGSPPRAMSVGRTFH